MENANEKSIAKARKKNQNLYKIYKMISWDLLFYYAISFLFLNQEKGLSTSQIIFADAFYPLFKLILQIPSTILIEKLGKRRQSHFREPVTCRLHFNRHGAIEYVRIHHCQHFLCHWLYDKRHSRVKSTLRLH